ncbi:MAG: Rdx family protein [Chloroflexi bacterium]|nr:Rdx family protein [Chloroflexota bacterium]
MAGEIIDAYGDDLQQITLIRGTSGQFEVMVDGQNIFSKEIEHRHANPGEITGKIAQLGAG